MEALIHVSAYIECPRHTSERQSYFKPGHQRLKKDKCAMFHEGSFNWHCPDTCFQYISITCMSRVKPMAILLCLALTKVSSFHRTLLGGGLTKIPDNISIVAQNVSVFWSSSMFF